MRKTIIALALFLGMPLLSHSQNKAKGYRAFVDITYTIGQKEWEEKFFSVQTSHGYQFLPWLYTGAGVMLDMKTSKKHQEARTAQFFADLRSDFLRTKHSPFANIKIGYSFLGASGIYFNPNIGYRFSLNKSIGANIGLGYNAREVKFIGFFPGGGRYTYTKQCNGFHLSFGIDF